MRNLPWRRSGALGWCPREGRRRGVRDYRLPMILIPQVDAALGMALPGWLTR